MDLQTTYRAILDAARSRRYISYGDLAKANGADWKKVRFDMNFHLGNLMELAAKRGWPIQAPLSSARPTLPRGHSTALRREDSSQPQRTSDSTSTTRRPCRRTATEDV